MRGTRSIRTRLLTGQLAVIGVLSGTILTATYFGAERAVRSLSGTMTQGAVTLVELELQRFFEPVGRALESACAALETDIQLEPVDVRSEALLLASTSAVPQIVAATFETGDQRSHYRRDGKWLRVAAPGPSALSSGDGAARDSGRAKALAHVPADPDEPIDRQVVWSPPHRSSDDEDLVMTATLGCARDDAAAAFDISLGDLSRFVQSIGLTANGGITVMTENLRLITHPEKPAFWTGPSPGGWLLLRPGELEVPLVDDAIRAFTERSGQVVDGVPLRFESTGERWWAQVRRYDLSPDTSLLIAVLIPTSDLFGERLQIRAAIGAATIVVLAIAVAGALLLSRRISEPIEQLVTSSEEISRGNLDRPSPIRSQLTEVQVLAEAHEMMRDALRSLIKLESDLALARQIQRQALPERLPRIGGFELAAWSESADATGGDTYDAFQLEDGRAFLVVADASGHGVAPALCVTQLRAMLRIALRLQHDLSAIASEVNYQLFKDLPANRFITAWIAELAGASGIGDAGLVRWLSAGHGPILHYQRSSGVVRSLEATSVPLGVLETLGGDSVHTTRLETGDVLAVVTDGLFEALDRDGHELGKERLADRLAACASLTAEEIANAIRDTVRSWSAGASLADDRTALVVKRQEPAGPRPDYRGAGSAG